MIRIIIIASKTKQAITMPAIPPLDKPRSSPCPSGNIIRGSDAVKLIEPEKISVLEKQGVLENNCDFEKVSDWGKMFDWEKFFDIEKSIDSEKSFVEENCSVWEKSFVNEKLNVDEKSCVGSNALLSLKSSESVNKIDFENFDDDVKICVSVNIKVLDVVGVGDLVGHRLPVGKGDRVGHNEDAFAIKRHLSFSIKLPSVIIPGGKLDNELKIFLTVKELLYIVSSNSIGDVRFSSIGKTLFPSKQQLVIE